MDKSFVDEAEFKYLNEDRIDNQFTCPICLQILRDARMHSECGRLFCSECIALIKRHHIKKVMFKPKLLDDVVVLCPICQINMTKNSLEMPPQEVQSRLSALRIICVYCIKVLRRGGWESHKQSCKKREEKQNLKKLEARLNEEIESNKAKLLRIKIFLVFLLILYFWNYISQLSIVLWLQQNPSLVVTLSIFLLLTLLTFLNNKHDTA